MNDRPDITAARTMLRDASNTDAVITALHDAVVNLVGTEQLAIFTISEGSARLSLARCVGIDAGRYHDIPIGAGVIGRVAATGTPANTATDPGAREVPGLTVCFPLRHDGIVRGVVAVFELLPHRPALTDTDLTLLQVLSDESGAALARTASAGGDR